MIKERIPEREAIIDINQIEDYIRLSEKLMGYVYKDVIDKAMKLTPITGKVLDVGTGFGMLAITLAQRNPNVEVIGLDISDKMAEAGKTVMERTFSKNIVRNC